MLHHYETKLNNKPNWMVQIDQEWYNYHGEITIAFIFELGGNTTERGVFVD